MSLLNDDYALVVGVNFEATAPFLRPLRACEKDATDFCNWLLHKEGGGMSQDRIRLLTQSVDGLQSPDRRAVANHFIHKLDDELNKLLRKVRENGGARRFYFFFSGHGIQRSKITSLIMPGYHWSKMRSAALYLESYVEYLIDSKLFDEIICFLDCCRTSEQVDPKYLRDSRTLDTLDENRKTPNRRSEMLTVWGCLRDAESFEHNFVNKCGNTQLNGNFTRSIIAGLCGACPQEEAGVVHSEELIDFLKSTTMNLAKRLSGKSQEPTADYQDKTGFKFGAFSPRVDFSIAFETGPGSAVLEYGADPMREEVFDIPPSGIAHFKDRLIQPYFVRLANSHEVCPVDVLPNIDQVPWCIHFQPGKSNGIHS